MHNFVFRFVALVLVCGAAVTAQTIGLTSDDTRLKQVIIFGRHGVRTPNSPNSVLDLFSTQLYPVFPNLPGNPTDNPPSILTANGAAAETLLGGYFRLWLIQEGLLSGNDTADAQNIYFRADDAPLIIDTAQAFASGLLPAANVTINTVIPATSDQLFDPVDAGVAVLNEQQAVAAVNGRLGSDPQALTTAYADEFGLIRSVLFNYPAGQTPVPSTPAGKTDVTAGSLYRSRWNKPPTPAQSGRAADSSSRYRSLDYGIHRRNAGLTGCLGPVDRKRHQPGLPRV